MSRRRIGAAAVVAALLVALALLLRRGASASVGGEARVRRGDLVTEVDVSGTLRAVRTQQLGPPMVPDVWDFKVTMLGAEGKPVAAGQPVLAFDDQQLRQKLEEKLAEAEQAAKEIEKKEADVALAAEQRRVELAEVLARVRRTDAKLAVPVDLVVGIDRKGDELDHSVAVAEAEELRRAGEAAARAAAAEVSALRSRRDRAAARVAAIRRQVESLTVLAPVAGVLIHVPNWRNEKKKVGDSSWAGERIVEVPDLTRMKAVGDVDEIDAARVAIGQAVRFRLDAHPDEEIVASVASIGNTVQRQSPQSPLRVLRLELAIAKSDPERMRPGMRFRGSVETGRRKGVLLVPIAAVLEGDRGTYVRRRGATGFEEVAVKLGARSASEVEVVSGALDPGDRIALGGSA